MPNQRELAQKLGLTQATVSMALRDHPLVATETKRRVQEAARKMGYRASPFVTTLMARIRAGRAPQNLGCIAILLDNASKDEWLAQERNTYSAQYAGYQRRAARRGYRTECFCLRAPGMSDEAIDRQLHARGIIGLILAAPKHLHRSPVHLRWENYACATVSYTWTEPVVDRVSSHHRHNMDRAFAELLARGCKRIGFCLPKNAVRGVDANWMAGYLVAQAQLPKARRLPAFIGTIHDTPLDTFRAWHDRWQPDGLITLLGEEARWLTALHRSPYNRETGVLLVCLNRPADSPFPGIDENNTLVGEMACDLVVNQLTHNERGLPEHRREILVEGRWIEPTQAQ
ncbi:LacI family transcriptional regulator [Opitutaceae bacterium TAV4]|uniref:LacI family DNA-binding transcriptional regulator n=1 Tax=Geminisphaera colitermitum TaxID=1148786 RepID=UPI000158D49E|nr:LacI family DNA-binding transcriptional regulator [Geminisphaera colitermitum]RRJ94307.1 LacI family transcriptional regulator [Opitutaceae bacterium TAV4]RRJ98397.1 LacI family transcriptional regulator [Opitutaceae bacterium TAV3]